MCRLFCPTPPCLSKTFRATRKLFRARAKIVRLPVGIAVRLQPGIPFAFTPESFSRSPRNPFRLAPESALVCGHQVGGPKPKGERSLRVVKDSPGRQRNLVPTRSTLPTFLLRQCISLAVSALTTHEAIRPPAVSQILLARFFAGELRLKFAQRLRKGRARHDPTLLLVAC